MGRKDSKTASYDLARENLPTADEGLLSIISKFLYQGLSVTDMVALAGKLFLESSVMNIDNALNFTPYCAYFSTNSSFL